MTTYGHDPTASTIVAIWSTGAVAHRVARVPACWDPELARRAAGALTTLSARLWLAYAEEAVADVPVRRIAEAARRPFLPVGALLRCEDDERLEAATTSEGSCPVYRAGRSGTRSRAAGRRAPAADRPGCAARHGLIRGIHGCFRVYVDEISSRDGTDVDRRMTWSMLSAELRARFCNEVREATRALQ